MPSKKGNPLPLVLFLVGLVLVGSGLFIASGFVPVVPETVTCNIGQSAIQINAISVSPNPVGTGESFTVSGTMFSGSGCPLSDVGVNYAVYSVYWWIPSLTGYSGSFVVQSNGAFTITNIPDITTSGSYTIIVSPYAENQQSSCVDTSLFTCTNAQTTVTVQSTQVTTYQVLFNIGGSQNGQVQIEANGISQYASYTNGQSATFNNVIGGTYSYSVYPTNPSTGTCYNSVNGTVNIGNLNVNPDGNEIQVNTPSFNCTPPNSGIQFNITPLISGTFTFDGQNQTIPSNGILIFTNIPTGTYSFSVSPAQSYPNNCYVSYSGSIFLPYGGSIGSSGYPSFTISLATQSCTAPTTVTTTVSSSVTGSITSSVTVSSTVSSNTSSSSSSASHDLAAIENAGIGIFVAFIGFVFIVFSLRKK